MSGQDTSYSQECFTFRTAVGLRAGAAPTAYPSMARPGQDWRG
jgi:hypothetical protein